MRKQVRCLPESDAIHSRTVPRTFSSHSPTLCVVDQLKRRGWEGERKFGILFGQDVIASLVAKGKNSRERRKKSIVAGQGAK